MDKLKALRMQLSDRNIDGIIISTPHNRFYLSKFTGSAGWLYIDSVQANLITDFRYVEQAQKEAMGYNIVMHQSDAYTLLAKMIKVSKAKRIAFEGKDTHIFYNKLQQLFWDSRMEWIEGDEILSKMRRVKTLDEVESIREAAAIGDMGFQFLLDTIRPGMTERQIALELEFYMKKQGADELSFQTIIASGERSALPHGLASDRILHAGDLVVMDFGCIYHHYCSDMTRTIGIEPMTKQQIDLYDLVKEAQVMALKSVKVGMRASELDAVARDIISNNGFGSYFGHGLGHGVGLEVHEEPNISPSNDLILEENMIITIEPGVYLEGLYGVRIEDLICIKRDGYELMCESTKQLKTIHL